ncbi:farnesol dehydrogenase-like [Atheta coriaria]|uniref:farnesol dehydrogenase-like n=1 Tax=Dalotia coriaria TaxID=877792 RepID=UPI0031F44830
MHSVFRAAFVSVVRRTLRYSFVSGNFNWAISSHGPVHILINNAGVARPTDIIGGDTQDFKRVLETNLLAFVIAAREACQSMIDNGVDGHIININSIVGHYVPIIPLINVYPAAKHGVTALTETLRQELFRQGKKIKVTSVSPGYVKTEILTANGFMKEEDVVSIEAASPYLNSTDVADAVLYVLGTPENVQVTELTIRPVGEAV